MDNHTRTIVRSFYQGLALPDQLVFYREVITGDNDSRKAWLKANTDSLGVTPELAAVFLTLGSLSKEEVALIVVAKVAEELQPKVQNIFVRFWNWIFG